MLQIAYRKLDELNAYANNARKHPKKQIEKLAANIRNFGFLVPVLVDERGTILAGHGRVEAAKLAGIETVPAISVEHLTEAQKRAFILADNRLAQDASWDIEKLKVELEFLGELDFEVNLTGFETVEIDMMFKEDFTNPPEDEIEVPSVDYQPVTKMGDIWVMGPHRLICGNSLQAEAYRTLIGDDEVEMVFTDPPYNVEIDGHVKRKSGSENREFVMASGEMSENEFTHFLRQFLQNTTACLKDGAIVYSCMDWRHMWELQNAAKDLLEFKQLCVWAKDQGGMGSFYRSQHELILVFKHGKASHINNFGLGAKGRYRTNLWSYPMVRRTGQPSMESLYHPTVKPTALVMDAILDCSNRKAIVLDPFGGSGTTLIAAEKTGRSARLIELDPVYCDMIIRRWEKFTKRTAFLHSANKSFEQMKDARQKVSGEVR